MRSSCWKKESWSDYIQLNLVCSDIFPNIVKIIFLGMFFCSTLCCQSLSFTGSSLSSISSALHSSASSIFCAPAINSSHAGPRHGHRIKPWALGWSYVFPLKKKILSFNLSYPSLFINNSDLRIIDLEISGSIYSLLKQEQESSLHPLP